MREKRLFLILALFGLGMGLSGCLTSPLNEETPGSAKFKEKKKGQETVSPLPSASAMQIPIGTIHHVDREGKFALIKSSRTTRLDPDTQLFSYGPDARMSSHLKISPARKGSFLTADFVDGVPSVGDMVMRVHTTNSTNKAEEKKAGTPDVQVLE